MGSYRLTRYARLTICFIPPDEHAQVIPLTRKQGLIERRSIPRLDPVCDHVAQLQLSCLEQPQEELGVTGSIRLAIREVHAEDVREAAGLGESHRAVVAPGGGVDAERQGVDGRVPRQPVGEIAALGRGGDIEQAAEVDDETRFGMLETVREYAIEQRSAAFLRRSETLSARLALAAGQQERS